MNKKIITAIIMLLAVVCTISADNEVKEKALVAAAVKQLGITGIDNLNPGTVTYSIQNQRVAVRVNALHEVEHIGIPIFPKEMRKSSPSPVYDFIEFALLDKLLNVTERHQAVNAITFTKGDWNNLLNITPEMIFNVKLDGTTYEVQWIIRELEKTEVITSLKFQQQYDVLSMSNKEELEKLLVHHLRTTDGPATNNIIPRIVPGLFSKDYVNKGIWMVPGAVYLKSSITANLYYRKRGSQYTLFSQSMYPAESLANILLAADSYMPKANLALSIMMYDGSVEKVTVSVADWLAAVKADGCRCHFGLDKQDGKTASMVIYANNQNKGYDHVLMLKCEIEDLDKQDITLTGQAYLYSPTSNVKNLFHKHNNNK